MYDGITYYRYDNASKSLTNVFENGLPRGVMGNDCSKSYTLSPTSTDITITNWYADGKKKM